mmetsp:Transcript_39176/g.63537  ORF Transcript_39176/g.63537 Transcript_39176/m.63537 type:complete len:119 (-) Transcript_39176:1935-2291(-)
MPRLGRGGSSEDQIGVVNDVDARAGDLLEALGVKRPTAGQKRRFAIGIAALLLMFLILLVNVSRRDYKAESDEYVVAMGYGNKKLRIEDESMSLGQVVDKLKEQEIRIKALEDAIKLK